MNTKRLGCLILAIILALGFLDVVMLTLDDKEETNNTMSVDAAVAEFIAALLRTLSEKDASFHSRFEESYSQLTMQNRVDALRMVKQFRYSNDFSDRQLREEIERFLAERS